MHVYPWGKSACRAWWTNALKQLPQHTASEGVFLCHPLTHLAWAEPLPSVPAELRLYSQLHAAFSDEPCPPHPALLRFPGPAVENSACRTLAMAVDWASVLRLARRLEVCGKSDAAADSSASSPAGGAVHPAGGAVHPTGGGVSPSADAPILAEREAAPAEACVGACGWQVGAASLELVIAHALLERPVAVRRVERAAAVHVDQSMEFARLRRAGRGGEVSCRDATPADDWLALPQGKGEGAAFGLLDSAAVMSSRDLEPIVWPKVWYFAHKLQRLGADDAAWRAFGSVPVRWVPAAGRWMTGSRHRQMAARLLGVPFAAVPASGSAWP
ncbi:hypothetical protein AB1Y20_007768 [Prymnesium parvum]|uniref:Uncharacterized protein n=1 Tax=Prymnesium parvum TaxID=97485 RepID=A0AB34IUP7_PRYPA